MEIPQNKTRGEMQAYVTITEARPKAKEEPCSVLLRVQSCCTWKKKIGVLGVQCLAFCKTTQVLGVLYFCTFLVCDDR